MNATAIITADFRQLAMHMKEVFYAAAFMQIVDILCNDRKAPAFALKASF